MSEMKLDTAHLRSDGKAALALNYGGICDNLKWNSLICAVTKATTSLCFAPSSYGFRHSQSAVGDNNASMDHVLFNVFQHNR